MHSTDSHSSIHSIDLPIGDRQLPLRLVVTTKTYGRRDLANAITDTFDSQMLMALISSCRGVGIDRLPVILSTGYDVEPTDAPFFTGPLEKALEYGCVTDQVIQIFHPRCLDPSWREHPASIPQEKRESIERDFPTVIPSVDGTRLWFTRFRFEDTRAATDYEREYGHWIRGDARQALAGLIILTADPSAQLRNLGQSEAAQIQNPERFSELD
jgi:hypothetical protein